VLVLTRRANESVMIGANVIVTVLEVRGEQVRLGIQAPSSVPIHREEVFIELAKANRESGSPNAEVIDTLNTLARPNQPPD
jgi:carbon storage regulator